MNIEAVLARVDSAFATCAKPEHFTDWTYCLECRDFDRLLGALCLDSIRQSDLEGAGGDPMLACNPVGYAYYAPALARWALAPPERSHEWYGDKLLFHLSPRGGVNRHLNAFSREQCAAVAELLAALPRAYPTYSDAEEIGRFDAVADLRRVPVHRV